MNLVSETSKANVHYRSEKSQIVLYYKEKKHLNKRVCIESILKILANTFTWTRNVFVTKSYRIWTTRHTFHFDKVALAVEIIKLLIKLTYTIYWNACPNNLNYYFIIFLNKSSLLCLLLFYFGGWGVDVLR